MKVHYGRKILAPAAIRRRVDQVTSQARLGQGTRRPHRQRFATDAVALLPRMSPTVLVFSWLSCHLSAAPQAFMPGMGD